MALSKDAADEIFRSNHDMFGVAKYAYYISCGGNVLEGAVSLDEEAPPAADQAWHLGSCTKAVTATIVAHLVYTGEAFAKGYDTSIGDVLGGEVPEGVRGITLHDLLAHRSGLKVDMPGKDEDALEARLLKEGASATQQRAAFVKELLEGENALAHPPQSTYMYSNAGYAVVGALVEAATKATWEDVVGRVMKEVCGAGAIGFGNPPGLLGVTEDGEAQKEGQDDKVWHRASFAMHMPMQEWAKFAHFHAEVARQWPAGGAGGFLESAAVRAMHTPYSPATPDEEAVGEIPSGYGLGWKTSWDESPTNIALMHEGVAAKSPQGVLWHWGTNFLFNTGAYVDTARQLVILCASNNGSSMARLAQKLAFDAIIEAVPAG